MRDPCGRYLKGCALIGGLSLVSLLAGCGPLIDQPGTAVVWVEARDAGATVDLERGQQLQVSLDSNRTTGYQWLLIDQTGGILQGLADDPVYEEHPNDAGLLGRGGTERWTFRPVRPGEGLLRFEYRRPWENGREAIQSAVFKIRVK
mgnify:CR=1 FL=1